LRLMEILPPEASVANPIDVLPTRSANQIRQVFSLLSDVEKDAFDVAVFITGNSELSDMWPIFKEVMDAMDGAGLPVIPVLSPLETCADLLKKFAETGKIYFAEETAVARALGKIIHRPSLYDPERLIDRYDKEAIRKALERSNGCLGPDAVMDLLSAAGFRLPPQTLVHKESELMDACLAIGYPLVIKVVGPLHKSDVGGVKVGISSLAQAKHAWRELRKIPGAGTVLVQGEVPGIEVIVGASREKGFGHLIMFGLGGIFIEVLKDVRFVLAPLSLAEAHEMIRGIRAYPILKGIRGQQGLSIDTLADYLVRLGRLVSDFPEIREIDLNPVKGFDASLFVVDARILKD
jgi:acyl-CoA synthetase (NDP forming)